MKKIFVNKLLNTHTSNPFTSKFSKKINGINLFVRKSEIHRGSKKKITSIYCGDHDGIMKTKLSTSMGPMHRCISVRASFWAIGFTLLSHLTVSARPISLNHVDHI